jgi:hypothetical protein
MGCRAIDNDDDADGDDNNNTNFKNLLNAHSNFSY